MATELFHDLGLMLQELPAVLGITQISFIAALTGTPEMLRTHIASSGRRLRP